MFLDFTKENVYTVVWNDFSNFSQAELQALKPEDCLRKVQYNHYNKWDHGLVYEYDKFYSKLNFHDGSLEDKSFYIDPNCNINIDELGITKKRSHNLADVCVIPKYNNAKGTIGILYNKETDEYIVVHALYVYHTRSAYSRIKDLFSQDFIREVVSYNIFPSFELIYLGPVDFITSKKRLKFFQTVSKYHDCIYEEDFRTFILGIRTELTDEMFSNIFTLFNSTEKENSNLALQLLYTTNPRPYAYRIFKMLNSKCYLLDTLSFYHDSKFNEFLSRINLVKKDLKNGYYFSRKKIYEITGKYEKDLIINEVLGEYKQATHLAEIRLKSYKFADITIEPAKVIVNEENFSDSRE